MRHPFLKAAAAIGVAALVSCSGGDDGSGPSTPPPTPVASVSVAPASASIMVGSTTTLTATPLDAANNPLSGRSVTWTSSDQSVATVSTNGVVTGVAPGSAAVTATSEGRSGSAQITVQAPVASVSVAPANSTLLVGATAALTATLRDATNNVLTGRTVTWLTSNPSVATVSPAGVVTAVAAGGPVTITATSEGQSGTAQVTVIPPVASITVTPASATLLVGATVGLTATVRDTGGNVLTGRTVTWTNSNGAIASVSQAGLVTGIAPGGPVTITATCEGQAASAQITVTAPVATVTVAPAASSILVGATTGLSATLRDAAGNVLAGRATTWSTSNGTVATVSQAGVVTGLSAGGPVLITATSEGQSGTAQVTVLAPVASVVFTGNFRTKVGDTYQYTATARLADGTVVIRPMTWSVEETNKASITQGGLMTPLQTGTITLQVTIDGVTWEATASAYDWFAFGSGTVFGVALAADLSITNKWGTTEYPDLAMGCSGGAFVLFVGTDNFVTSSGGVTYGFDNDPLENAVWLEFDSFSNLGHPGPDNSTRAFAVRLALARKFWFAFTEFNGPAKATMFRVTGLASRLGAFTTCPTSSPAASPGIVTDPVSALQALAGKPAAMTPERALRAELRAAAVRAPELTRSVAPATVQEARRRPEPR